MKEYLKLIADALKLYENGEKEQASEKLKEVFNRMFEIKLAEVTEIGDDMDGDDSENEDELVVNEDINGNPETSFTDEIKFDLDSDDTESDDEVTDPEDKAEEVLQDLVSSIDELQKLFDLINGDDVEVDTEEDLSLIHI
jgi:hypothetical protein